jgi:hypothetical protein
VPRIRTIKPDAFKSDSLAHVNRGVRWTFAGLWTYADDSGRGRDDVRLVKAELYALDDEVPLSLVAEDLNQLEQIGSICRYEVDGKRYFHLPRWGDHQRVSHPTPSKFPECPRCIREDSGAAPEEIVKPPESLRPERKGKEQGKEGRTRASARTKYPTPDDWAGPNEAHRLKAKELEVDADQEAEKFRDYWRAKAPKYKDPDAAFRNWLRQAAKWGTSSYSPNQAPAASPVSRKHIPEKVPDDIDPDDPIAYAKWAKEATR